MSEDIQDLIIQDLIERRRLGIERYGRPVQIYNNRNHLQDLYEELMDAVVYVKAKLEEMKVPQLRCKNCKKKWVYKDYGGMFRSDCNCRRNCPVCNNINSDKCETCHEFGHIYELPELMI